MSELWAFENNHGKMNDGEFSSLQEAIEWASGRFDQEHADDFENWSNHRCCARSPEKMKFFKFTYDDNWEKIVQEEKEVWV